ncbi:MAG: DUF3572 domain-containing protein [Pseudomonadota bacterium]|nr:DUF3572 domain-containing protein [Pseudomonadota bacterium]
MENSPENNAEVLALQVLTFVLSKKTLRDRFIALSGLSVEEISERVSDKEFLGGVLDFLLFNENDVLWFCKEHEVDPQQPKIARDFFLGNSMREK